MTEFHIGQMVRILPTAECRIWGIGRQALVEGYESEGGEDFVIVTVQAEPERRNYEQWLRPGDVAPLQ